MRFVAGLRWVVRGKDAGSGRIRWIRARLRTPHRAAQRGPAAQLLVRDDLLDLAEAERVEDAPQADIEPPLAVEVEEQAERDEHEAADDA